MIFLAMADTHNNLPGIQSALAIGRQHGATEVLHCGDLTSESMLDAFECWTLHLALGNMDRNPAGLRARVERLGNRSECAPEIHLVADGVRIAMTHGDKSGSLMASIRRADQDFYFHGHTHRRRDEQIGPVRVINPGCLGGTYSEPLSFCLLDTKRRVVIFHSLNTHPKDGD
jgi:uncharacterized protein